MTDVKKSILVSSYSFAPRKGSESGTGWFTVQSLAKKYQVHVVCAGYYRAHFTEEDLDLLEQQGVFVTFHRTKHHEWMRRLPGGLIWFYYSSWQRSARRVFEEIVKRHRPVLAQHVTWGSGRVPTQLTELGIPVVFGPVGGFESGSWQIAKHMNGWKFRAKEWFRTFTIRRSMKSSALRRMYAKVGLTLACTKESEDCIRTLGCAKIVKLTNAGISEEKLRILRDLKNAGKTADQPFTMLLIGRMIGWKGEELVIRAAASLPDRNWRLTMLGEGGNRSYCIGLAKRLGVDACINFVDSVPQDEVWGYYAASDLFVFPSLHDSGGNAVLEAMGAGLPVVCLDLGGPAEFIDETCGEKIKAGPIDEVIRALACAMQRMRGDPEDRKKKGRAAAQRCQERFTWEAHGEKLLELVEEVVGRQ